LRLFGVAFDPTLPTWQPARFIHGLEAAQCMSERRREGEVGIQRVQALRGARIREYMATREKTQRLPVAALTRSHTLPVEEGYPSNAVTFDLGTPPLSRRPRLFHRAS